MHKLITIFVLALSALSAVSAASTGDGKKSHQKCVYKCPDIHGDHYTSSMSSKALVCVYEHKKKEKKPSKSHDACFYDKDKGNMIEDKYKHKCPHKAKKVCKKSD